MRLVTVTVTNSGSSEFHVRSYHLWKWRQYFLTFVSTVLRCLAYWKLNINSIFKHSRDIEKKTLNSLFRFKFDKRIIFIDKQGHDTIISKEQIRFIQDRKS